MAKGVKYEYTENQEVACRRLRILGFTLDEIVEATGLPAAVAWKLIRNVSVTKDGHRVLQRWVADKIVLLQPGDPTKGELPLPTCIRSLVLEADKRRDAPGEFTMSLLSIERQTGGKHE